MKIALHVDGPIIRGNEEQALQIARLLKERGHELVVSCRANGPVQQAMHDIGVRTTGIRPRGDVDVWSALRFAWWLRRERPDAVLLTSWVRAFIAGWAAHIAGVPRIVFRLGGTQPIDGKRGSMERRALRRWYHAIIVNSREIAEQVIRGVPDLADRVHTVANGLGPIDDPEPVPLRAELGVPDDALLAIAVGGLEPRKGYDLLIDAVATVEGVHAVLVGGGSPEQRNALEQHALRAGVAHRVHFMGRRDDVAALLAACDLFVLSSREEGFAMARLEAMRARLPVIATEVGGTWESHAAREGRGPGGWIVPLNDSDALALALRQVTAGIRAGSSDVAARIDEAEWRVHNWFTLDHMADGYEAVLTGSRTLSQQRGSADGPARR